MDYKEAVSRMTDEDVVTILCDLGSDYPREARNSLIFQTVCHGGEKHKLYYYRDTKAFQCYSNCGHFSNIFNVVMQAKDCSFGEAYKYVCEKLGYYFSSTLRYGFQEESIDNSFINRFEVEKEKVESIIIRDPVVLKRFRDLYHHTWVEDNISTRVMRLFGIKYDILDNAIIIPHYNMNGDLIGIRARYLNEDMVAAGRKYMPITIDNILYNYPTSLNLYGLNINKENIIKYKRVVIGEAEKFVMQHRSYYEDSVAVALNGSTLSEYQVHMLLDLGVETVVLALDKEFDNPEDEKKYKEKINRTFISKLLPYFTVEIIWDQKGLLDLKDSPTDKGKAVYEQLYSDRIILS